MRYCVSIALLLCLGLLWLIRPFGAKLAADTLILPPGEIGTTINFDWAIKNPSIIPLTLDKIATSCSCTWRTSQETIQIAPFQEARIPFQILVDPGLPETTVTLHASSSGINSFTAKTEVVVKSTNRLAVIPEKIMLSPTGDMGGEKQIERSLSIKLLDKTTAISSVQIECDDPLISCNIIETKASEATARFAVPRNIFGEIYLSTPIQVTLTNGVILNRTVTIAGCTQSGYTHKPACLALAANSRQQGVITFDPSTALGPDFLQTGLGKQCAVSFDLAKRELYVASEPSAEFRSPSQPSSGAVYLKLLDLQGYVSIPILLNDE